MSASISVVMATYERRDACRRAIHSVLAQDPSPREVLVSDDGSTEGTREMLEQWACEEPRLRVLPHAGHLGTPAPHRNRGIQAATGDWVAFLDDDDEWLPGKLAAQLPYLKQGYDVIATNAIRSSGTPYFPDAPEAVFPSRGLILHTNPVIISSAIVRRDLLLRVGGLEEERWVGAIADYALWLAASDHGARFAILGEPLVRYDDADSGRMSTTPLKVQLAVARLFWRRWRAQPDDPALRRAALSKASYALTVAKGVARSRFR